MVTPFLIGSFYSFNLRALGSTGNRQGGGRRVYKNKKMAGRMGGKTVTMQNLQVFKIDAVRNLIYVKGSIPGRAGNLVKIRDAIKAFEKNQEYLNCPTFIPEVGKAYSNEIQIIPPDLDPLEQYLHDNDVIE